MIKGYSHRKNKSTRMDDYNWFLTSYINDVQRKTLLSNDDPVRYGCFLLALEQINDEPVSGSFAECGVYKGALSKFIHASAPDRTYYLFDTFDGFDKRDQDCYSEADNRFKDTGVDQVLNHIGEIRNIVIKKGFFPETTTEIIDEKFSLVILDFDKYEPTLAALKFFYPLLSVGGFMFIHDYNNPESNWACSRALKEFLSGKAEKMILIPDAWGSAVFRKI